MIGGAMLFITLFISIINVCPETYLFGYHLMFLKLSFIESLDCLEQNIQIKGQYLSCFFYFDEDSLISLKLRTGFDLLSYIRF